MSTGVFRPCAKGARIIDRYNAAIENDDRAKARLVLALYDAHTDKCRKCGFSRKSA